MTLLIEALSGVLDTFLLYLFASGFYSKYRSTKYKGHLYLLVGIFIIVMSCIPMPGILRILLSWSIISVSTYAIFESTVRKALLTSTAFITLSVLVDVICEYPFYLSGISRTVILGQGLARCIFIIFAKLINLLLILFIVTLFGKKGLLDIPFKELLPLTSLPACQCIYLHCIIGIGRNRIALSFNIINTFYCRNFVHQHCILRIYASYSYKLRKRAAAAFG